MGKLSKQNKAFWALDKRNKRIAIAKDVIRMVELGKLDATKGTYVHLSETPEEDGKLDEFINEEGVKCHVCALGAIFVGLVDMGDKITIKESIDNYTSPWRNLPTIVFEDTVLIGFMREKLRDIFSSPQIALIESAFEIRTMNDEDVKFPSELKPLRKNAIHFGRKYRNDEDRVIAIMKNIIKNRGTFRPDKP